MFADKERTKLNGERERQKRPSRVLLTLTQVKLIRVLVALSVSLLINSITRVFQRLVAVAYAN